MFDVLPKALASVASFLFPVYASYKALNTADPAQLTPWLMYWVVLACVLLVESWTDWILVWVPFYHYFRLFFLLYLVLPQTQGARVLYQSHVHPWIVEHETQIDELIGSAYARLRSAGMHYLKQAIAYLRTALGLPVAPEGPPSSSSPSSSPFSYAGAASAQSYTQSLLARFTLPSARWPGGAMGAAATSSGLPHPAAPGSGTDFYSMLATAVGALGTATGAAGAAGGVAAGAAASAFSRGLGLGGQEHDQDHDHDYDAGQTMAASGTLVPPHIQDADRASFLATQRDRLRTLLSALEREAAQLDEEDEVLARTAPLSRPLSSASGLSKSRSEADFEKIDAESGTEEDKPVRQRRHGGASGASGSGAGGGASVDAQPSAGGRTTSGSWMPWGWRSGGSEDTTAPVSDTGKSSSVEQ
ncbi:HVA22 domain membrane protein [Sporothrix schenckii 1099-18]|uniref:HVA22 domain membrane protein n=1 Tax=Sporothrix schenckii 1099-18 TaxID=1397361 RepID=A0A0F2MB54_SPOSC|nr:HVA22 domain membrane protein [Sporothrix schenckii 1099-18]KJR86314.1 HVA22 domain membrane protein [Sporothrix schenckii 1099-18]